MLDTEKTKEQLLDELAQLHQQVQALEHREEQCRQREQAAQQQLAQEQTARSQAEQSLQAVVQELNTLQERCLFVEKLTEMSPGLLYLFDTIEQRNIYLNGRSLDLLGYAPEVVLAMGADFISQQMHPDDFAQMPAYYEQLAKATDGSFLELEYRMRHANGAWRWFRSRDTVFSRTTDGKIWQILGTAEDITERRQTEASLQESHDLFQSFMNHSPIAAFIKDEAGRYLYANPWIERVYQRSQADLIGKTDFELLPPAIAEQFRVNDLAVLTSGQSLQMLETIHHTDGEHSYMSFKFPFRNALGQQVLAGVAIDVSERIQAEAALQQREQEFRTLVENTPDIIVRYDRELHHLYINPSIERAVGIPPAQFIGKTAVELGFTDKRSQTWFATVQQVFETGQSYSLEYEFPNPAGELRFYQARFVPELIEGNHIATVVGVARDITEYKQAELSLRQSEERLRLAMEGAQMGTWDVDLKTGKAIWSEQHFTMMGYAPVATGEASEQMWSDRIHPSDLQRVIQAWQQARHDRTLYEAEYRVIRADNRQIAWLAGLGSFTYDQNGQAVRSIGVLFDITNRKQVEAALAKSNQTLQALIQACPLAIAGFRADGIVRIWNPAAERIFGWSQEEVLGRFLPTVPDNKQEEFLNNLAVTIQGQSLVGVETQRQKKGNILFDVELWTAPVDEAQAGISCISVIADITARKQIEAALRLNEERLHSFVTANVIGILFGDLEGGIQEANDEFLRIVGYTREELVAGELRWIDITPPEYLPLDEAAIIKARRRGACTPYEKEYIRKDGSRVPVLVGFGLVLAVREEAVAFILDLSDRKQAEESLRQSEERLRLALLVGKSGIWDWDIANNHITWSEQIYQFHGLTPETFSGKVEDFAKLIHPEDRAKMSDAIRYALEEQSSYEIEFRAVQPTGAVRWLSTTGGVIFDQQGSPVRMLGATIDITERKAIEAEREQLLRREQSAREQAEAANRIKDEFLAVLSHELRTPLNPILGWTKLLRTRPFDTAAADRALETIERNAKLQAQLIEDLLDVSRILQGKVRLNACPVNLVTTIAAALETVRLSADAKGIQIQTVLDTEVGQINGDASRIQQILWNLLSNAVKFTPSGGRVEVRLDRIGACAQIRVSDTGQGISPGFLPYVFEYFRQADSSTTRQFGGLGLGLAIVRHLVELHGGTVKAESPGSEMGATFTVQLPLMVSVLTPDLEALPTQGTKNLNGICILIVEDEADMRDLLRFILEEQGATVSVAASATEALQQLTQSVPDVLLSDIGMPEMDGYALMRQIHTMLSQQGKTIRAIALTAYAGEINQQLALAAGFQLHISKPVEPDHLISMIVSLMAR